MKITAKNGTEIELTITGTQETPEITAEKFVVQGVKVYGKATTHTSLRRSPGSEAGLLFWTSRTVYIQCADAMPAIQAAIAELPHKQYWAQKVETVIDADGDRCTVQKWEFDRRLQTEKGTSIAESEMGSYLDSKNITEILITDAVQMWADEKEETHIKANKAGNARAKAMFDVDVAEVGYQQACENADIPKNQIFKG